MPVRKAAVLQERARGQPEAEVSAEVRGKSQPEAAAVSAIGAGEVWQESAKAGYSP
jgi:hypothetical protein